MSSGWSRREAVSCRRCHSSRCSAIASATQRIMRARICPIQSAGSAKFRFWPKRCWNVITPTSSPDTSNKPPPLDPGEIGAVVWMTVPSSTFRSADTIPSLIVRSSPAGAPIA